MFLLFEDQSKPVDSPDRYYIDLHIGAGVKTRDRSLESMMFIGNETQSPSFVKRLPIVPVQRGSESSPMQRQTPVQYKGLRKVASYPTMHSETKAQPAPSSPQKAGLEHYRNSLTAHNIMRVPSGRRESYGYTEESIQTLGERGTS